MSFKSYRSSQSKFRRINRLDVSAQTEPCELRALLSASAITVGMDEVSPSDCVEDKAGSDEVFIQDFVKEEGSSSEESDPSLAYTSFMLFDNAVSDETLIEESPVGGEESDPSLAYISFMRYDDVVSDETLMEEFPADGSENPEESEVKIYHSPKADVTEDGVVVEELFAVEDTPPADGWDPSWAYRSLAGSPDGAVDDAVKIDDAITEDGHPVDGEFVIIDEAQGGVWEESWAWRTLDQPDGVPVDSVGEELPDDFVVEPVESDGTIDPRILMSFGGPANEPQGSEIDFPDGETKEVVVSEESILEEEANPTFMNEGIEFEAIESPVALNDDSLVVFIRSSASVGSPEVQRTASISDAPAVESFANAAAVVVPGAVVVTPPGPVSTPSVTPATNIPTGQVASNSLFNSSRDKSAVGVATPSSSGATVGSSLGTKSTGTPKRAKSQLQSTPLNANESSELESLSPLTEEDEESPEVAPAPAEQDVLSDEKGTAEPNTISHNSGAESSSSVVVQNTRQPRMIRPGMIDEVMSDYAQNSFNA